jgi:hypothetical protein
MYNIGDKFTINGSEYTIWLAEAPIYHLTNSQNHGICCDEEYLTLINTPEAP